MLGKKKKRLISIVILFVVIITLSFFCVQVVKQKKLTLESVYKYKIRDHINNIDTIILLDKIIINSQNQCISEIIESQTEQPILSFYVAGHAYGTPNAPENINESLFPQFLELLPKIGKSKRIDFGVLTGDVLYEPEKINIDNTIKALSLTNIPYYISPGNHDLSKENDFIQRTDEYFIIDNNLFIILTPQENWSLDENQLLLINEALHTNTDVNNIFVFTHQLMWYEPDDIRFEGVAPNSYAGKTGKSNFWEKVIFLFDEYENDIYLFSGDVGAIYGQSGFSYIRMDNFHFIASGMGGNYQDNFLIVDVYSDGQTKIKILAITNKNFFELGTPNDWLKWKKR